MMKARRHLIAALAAASAAASAQPVKPSRVLVGFPPGGNVDILARVFAEKLADALGRPFIVETRPGATGQLAAEMVKASPGDGYTIMVCPDATLVVRPLTLKKAPYDPVVDFASVAHIGQSAQALGINAEIPAKDLREFAAWVKANPAKASVGLPGIGGSMHFFTVMIGQELGIKLQPVGYKGSGPVMADLAAGHVPSSVNPLGTMLAQTRAGKVRLIGVSGAQRASTAPDSPTFNEQGFPQLNMASWFGLFAPAGMPPELVGRMNAVVIQAERTAAIRDRMTGLDLEIVELSPADFAGMVKRDYERWKPVVKASGFTAEE
jgi:tripartite-type tricarboxylate transporter receptor subunit TctC